MIWVACAAIVVLLDEWLKFVSLQRLPQEGSLLHPGVIDFAIHKNWGIAFDIPFKLPLIVIVSIAIGVFLVNVIWKNRREHPEISAAAACILLGAAGNLFDRVVYGFTVDYIILFGRSAINLSDIIILTGVFWLLSASRRAHKDHPLSVHSH